MIVILLLNTVKNYKSSAHIDTTMSNGERKRSFNDKLPLLIFRSGHLEKYGQALAHTQEASLAAVTASVNSNPDPVKPMPTSDHSADPPTEIALLIADLYEVVGRLRRSGDVIARELGQSHARWQTLSVVSEGDWTVPHIASRLGVARQSVQRVADELVADRLAVLERNPRHRRSSILRLTPRGVGVLRALTDAARGPSARLVEHVSAIYLATTRATMKNLRDVLRWSEVSDED